MNKTGIVIIVLVIAAILGVMAWGYTKSPAPVTATGAPAALAAAQKFHDFGTISMANGKVAYSFPIANPTGSDITLSGLSTSCMCTAAYIVDGGRKEGPFGMPGMGGMNSTSHVIKAGGAAAIEVVFDPNAHGPAGVGTIERTIDLVDAEGRTLQLGIKAVVTP